MSVILDASAAMALIMHEPGEEKVRAEIGDAIISSVNMAEVYSTCTQRGLDADIIKSMFSSLGVSIVEFSDAHALLAGRLRTATRALGLSLGDRACLAVAILEKRRVLTADRPWKALDLGIDINLIR